VGGQFLRAEGLAPAAPSVWAGVALRIPIAEKAGLVVPSN